VIIAAVRAGRTARRSQRGLARFLAAAAHGLVTLQIALGVATVLTGIRPMVVTAHLGVGALLFVDLLSLFLSLGPLGAPQARPDDLSFTTPMAAGARA
jgi:heme A synthase